MSLKNFYADPYYQIRSFSTYLLAATAACVWLYIWHEPAFYRLHFSWWHLLYLPLAVYIGGISAVFIHNASHKSFPHPWLNEACGFLAGIHQLWGYRGWKLIHMVHHQYSDHTEYDPHPTKGRFFAEYLRNMFLRSSLTLSRRYRDHFGQSPRTRILQILTLGVFLAMSAALLAFWFLLLGPAAFLWFYVPSLIANHLIFAHINYYCHPLNPATGETQATNLTEGWYYKIANILWCGIYYHGNHHRKPSLFNPRHMPVKEQRA